MNIMNKALLYFGATVLAMTLVPTTADAQIACGARDTVVAKLTNKYSETRLGSGLAGVTEFFEVWTTEEEDGSWSISKWNANSGIMCLLVVGKFWSADQLKMTQLENLVSTTFAPTTRNSYCGTRNDVYLNIPTGGKEYFPGKATELKKRGQSLRSVFWDGEFWYEIWVSETTGEWTFLQTYSNGGTCENAKGNFWHDYPQGTPV